MVTAVSSRHPAPAVAPRLYGAGVALLALAGLAAWLAHYPFGPWLAGSLLAVYLVLVLVQPALWLVLLPALWPVVDLAPWTGQIHVNESDALVLATLAAVGLRELLAPPPPTLAGRAPARLTPAALGGFALLAMVIGVACLRGLQPLASLEHASLAGYVAPVNSLRVAKGYVLAFLLIPFLHLAVRRDGDAALRRFAAGMTLGLGSCALAALWERLAFPGFTNFSADYRTTALFWEMHVGGAALDAWLSLSFPFALAHLRLARSRGGRAVTLAVVGLGSYALFTTFSRVVYGSALVSALVLGAMAWLRPAVPAADRTKEQHLGMLVLLGVAGVAGCALSFQAGGYRGMAAFVGAVLVAYLGGGFVRGVKGSALIGGLLAGALFAVMTAVVGWWLPKGIYIIYGLAWGVAALVLVSGLRGRLTVPPALAMALVAWVIVSGMFVGIYWGEMRGVPEALLSAGLVLAAVAMQALSPRPFWIPRLRDVHVLAGVLMVAGMVVATLSSTYMGVRLAALSGDADNRLAHFRASSGLVHGVEASALGLGLGRYPESYFWNVPSPGVPGFLALQTEAGSRYMQIGGERRQGIFSEHLHLMQRLPGDPDGPFLLRGRVRSATGIELTVAVCHKHLLYQEGCTSRTFKIAAGPAWQDVDIQLDGKGYQPGGWPPRPAELIITAQDRGPIDIDSLQLLDGHLQSLLRNGDFERGIDFWFFSSDHDHLPWHAKNLFLQTYVEQGWLGVAALGLVLVTVLLHLAGASVRVHPMAPILLASVAGILTVGLVDSLVDMPRITFMLMLVLWLGAVLRQPPASHA